VASRYANYQEVIDDIAAESGDDESALDTVLLNILKSVVDQLNTLDLSIRKGYGSITLAANTYTYTIASSIADFMDVVTRGKHAFQLSNGTFVEMAESDSHFREGWLPATQLGPPTMARIIGSELQVRPTPTIADTMSLDYWKRLATPTLAGSVIIPDEYLNIVRAEVGQRIEGYNESDSEPARARIYGQMKGAILHAINRDHTYRNLPGRVQQEDPF
jgi:hypothetical protein